MKSKFNIVVLLLLVVVAMFVIEQLAQAKVKRTKAVAALVVQDPPLTSFGFEPLNYTEGGVHGVRISMDLAYVSNDFGDGVEGPLPFFMFRSPETTDHQFRETIIFVVDNISEAHN